MPATMGSIFVERRRDRTSVHVLTGPVTAPTLRPPGRSPACGVLCRLTGRVGGVRGVDAGPAREVDTRGSSRGAGSCRAQVRGHELLRCDRGIHGGIPALLCRKGPGPRGGFGGGRRARGVGRATREGLTTV